MVDQTKALGTSQICAFNEEYWVEITREPMMTLTSICKCLVILRLSKEN